MGMKSWLRLKGTSVTVSRWGVGDVKVEEARGRLKARKVKEKSAKVR